METDAVRRCCEKGLPETLEFLRDLVAINSFTRNPAGVNRVGRLIAERFQPLGLAAEFVNASDPGHGCHLVLRSPSVTDAPTIALISHLDTVFTEEEEKLHDFVWRPEGARIYGPGTNDIKGGTALMYQTLRSMREVAPALFASVNWMIFHNACEEEISTDFGEVCRARLSANVLGCLIFEADGGSGDSFSLVAARKGRATFDVTVSGRGAHAGGQHRRGANAVVQLARAIVALDGITDHAAGVTVNVGSVQGGTVANRVPHFAAARLEMRAASPEAYDRARERILALGGPGDVVSVDGGHRCHVIVRVEGETPPWPRNPGTDGLIALWQETGRELGIPVETEARGGLSDGNVLWNSFPTVDGLGPRGDNCHCSERSADGSKVPEWVDVTSFVPKALLNVMALQELVRRGL